MKILALGLVFMLLGAGSLSSVHRIVEYSDAPVVIECPATLLCRIDLKPGEYVDPKLLGSELKLFDPQVLYSGSAPHITLRPDAPGRRANFMFTAAGRHPHTYWLMVSSTSTDLPMMRVTYRYDGEDQYDRQQEEQRQARAAQSRPRPHVSPPPPTIAQVMDVACSANHDAYGITPLPRPGSHRGDDDILRAIHPARVCHTASQTFIQLAATGTERADIPVLMEVTSDGERVVNKYYHDGIYRVDDVAREYALIQGKTRVKIQWQPETTAAK